MKDKTLPHQAIINQILLTEERLGKKFDQKLDILRDELRAEMRAGFDGAGESFEELTHVRNEDRAYIDKVISVYNRESSFLQAQIDRLKNPSEVIT